jgi:adenylosuccinate synthase
VLRLKNDILRDLYHVEELDEAEILEEYIGYGRVLEPYIKDIFPLVHDALDRDANILLEGAQGSMLDLDFGTYPYVTSSSPSAGGALTGSGIPPRAVTCTIGVYKAYTTRVGYGPMPTELDDDLGDRLREQGDEFGTVTGRSRRVGWFDAAVARYSAALNGVDSVALTKLDVLDTEPVIKVCTGYFHRGQYMRYPMSNISHLKHCEPIYEEMPGWQTPIVDCRTWEELPQPCRDYVDCLAELLGAPVDMVSVGASRNQTIIRKTPY